MKKKGFAYAMGETTLLRYIQTAEKHRVAGIAEVPGARFNLWAEIPLFHQCGADACPLRSDLHSHSLGRWGNDESNSLFALFSTAFLEVPFAIPVLHEIIKEPLWVLELNCTHTLVFSAKQGGKIWNRNIQSSVKLWFLYNMSILENYVKLHLPQAATGETDD